MQGGGKTVAGLLLVVLAWAHVGAAGGYHMSLHSPLEHPRVTSSVEAAARAGVAALDAMEEVAGAEYVEVHEGLSRVGRSLMCTASARTSRDEVVHVRFLTAVEWVANATTSRAAWNPHTPTPPLPALALHGPLVVHAEHAAHEAVLVLEDVASRVVAYNVTSLSLARPLGMRQLLGAPRSAGDADVERGVSDVGLRVDDIPLHVRVAAAAWGAGDGAVAEGGKGVVPHTGGAQAPAHVVDLHAVLEEVQRQLRAHMPPTSPRRRRQRTSLRRVESVEVMGVPVYGMVVEVVGADNTTALWQLSVADVGGDTVGEAAHELLGATMLGAPPMGATVTRDARVYGNPRNATRLVHATWPMYHTSAVRAP